MSAQKILVTGGSGFIGAALTTRLVKAGHRVRVLDNNLRGAPRRLVEVASDIEFIEGDVRDAAVVSRAVKGMDEVHHLAFINGTEFFYKMPELVLEVGVKGMVNVIDACIASKVRNLILASSSEVYQTPPSVPTDESAPLIVPDPFNARYSYGGGKIISELLAINYGRSHFDKVLIFRPHNVYGPDMGFEHVIPQFTIRMTEAAEKYPEGRVPFEIQGDGSQTRSFCYVSDLVDGVMVMRDKGAHMNIYHIGTTEEVTVADLAGRVAQASISGREIDFIHVPLTEGSTQRRCPDISKLQQLGYRPKVSLEAGLAPTAAWYIEHRDLKS